MENTSLLVSLVCNLIQVIIYVVYLRMKDKEQVTLMKLLASRNFSEYSLGEKRLKEPEKPPEPSYDTVFEEKQNG